MTEKQPSRATVLACLDTGPVRTAPELLWLARHNGPSTVQSTLAIVPHVFADDLGIVFVRDDTEN
ncbi:MAG: hypothetical protein ACREHD_14605 [Pirellulales bacterium]